VENGRNGAFCEGLEKAEGEKDTSGESVLFDPWRATRAAKEEGRPDNQGKMGETVRERRGCKPVPGRGQDGKRVGCQRGGYHQHMPWRETAEGTRETEKKQGGGSCQEV